MPICINTSNVLALSAMKNGGVPTMTPAELLRCLLERAQKNPTSLARTIDASDRRLQPALSRFLRGKATPDAIKSAAEYFGLDISAFASERAAKRLSAARYCAALPIASDRSRLDVSSYLFL